MDIDPPPSVALRRAIFRHRAAYRAYDRLIPLVDPYGASFKPDAVSQVGLAQRREARHRTRLLSHPVSSLADGKAKARYLFGFAGDDYLISDREALLLLLTAMAA